MIRVLVVDDSAIMRAMLRTAFEHASDIEVVGEAADAYEAREQILQLQPDVITLDIEMPRMDGLSFLSRLMQYHPLPVVVVSSLGRSQSEAALRALSIGAVEVIAKPARSDTQSLRDPLIRAVRGAAIANVNAGAAAVQPMIARDTEHVPLRRRPRVIAMGASTGGPAAIERILSSMPADAPPMIVVQHMPAGFTSAFARRLDNCCVVRVKEAEDGEPLERGTALIAPAGRHTVVLNKDGELRAALRDGPPIHYHRPAVDVLFHALARTVGEGAVGVLLTGMGADGASGMRALRDAGAYTIAQDEKTSVVFSMPFEAVQYGGVCEVLPVQRIAAAVLTARHGGRAVNAKSISQ